MLYVTVIMVTKSDKGVTTVTVTTSCDTKNNIVSS